MATKVIDIEVNDGPFQEFQKALANYQDKLAKLPGAWGKVTEAANAAAKAQVGAAEASTPGASATPAPGSSAASGAAQATENAAARRGRTSTSTAVEAWGGVGTPAAGGKSKSPFEALRNENSMLALAKRGRDEALRGAGALYVVTKGIAGNLESGTKSLLKWASLSGVLTGLLGVGSLFGLERLAASSSAATKSAQGLGTTTANSQAFDINYSRTVDDPTGLLGSLADARSDFTKRGAFARIGVSNHSMNGDLADLGVDVLNHAKDMVDRQGVGNLSQQWADANGLTMLGLSMADLRRLGQLTKQQLRDEGSNYQSDRRDLALNPATQKAWQDFNTQMNRAGQNIENVLIGKLAPLAEPLTNLSKVVVSFITGLADTKQLKSWIDDLGAGIKDVGAYLKTDDFGNAVKAFITNVSDLAKSAGDAFHWIDGELQHLGLKPSTSKTGWHFDLNTMEAIPNGPGQEVPAGLDTPDHVARQALRSLGFKQNGIDAQGRKVGEPGYDKYSDPAQWDAWRKSAVLVPKAQAEDLEAAGAKAAGVPAGFSAAIFHNEGGINSDGSAKISGAGAIGPGQLMPGTARGLGVKNPFDTAQNITGSVAYQKQMLDLFGGDPDKAAAAYNWGPGNLQNDLDQNGEHWRDYLPRETRKYVKDLDAQMGPSSDLRGHLASINQETAVATSLPSATDSGGISRDTQAIIATLKQGQKTKPEGTKPGVVIRNQTGGSAVVSGVRIAHG